MGNWIPGVSGLSPGELADGAGDAVDSVTPDSPMLPQPAEDAYQLTPMSAVTNSTNEYLEGDPVEATDDLLYNIPSFTSGVLSGDRENAVLDGLPREGYDWVFDYSGEWGNEEDQHDLIGPSFNPFGNWFGYNSDPSQDDPTRPTNWSAAVWVLVAAVVVGVFGYVLRPVFGLAENVTEGE